MRKQEVHSMVGPILVVAALLAYFSGAFQLSIAISASLLVLILAPKAYKLIAAGLTLPIAYLLAPSTVPALALTSQDAAAAISVSSAILYAGYWLMQYAALRKRGRR